MNLSFYLARKLSSKSGHSYTERIIRMASLSVAVSLAVMIIAIGIVKGFQTEIKQKLTGFNGHVLIKNLDLNHSGEMALFPKNQPFLKKIKQLPFVVHISPVCQKAGILKTISEAEGIQCKGVTSEYCKRFINKHLVRSKALTNLDSSNFNRIYLSETTANRLNLDTGQKVELFFIQDGEVRRRKPVIFGIFNTGIHEIDKNWAITDIRLIQRIYTHGYDSISGYEVQFNSLTNLEKRTKRIDEELGHTLKAQSINETQFQIFQWLGLLDMNVKVIIILMVIVAVVNMMTALLVLIIDRTPMIGLLKAMGGRTKLIRKLFLYNGAKNLVKGLVLGNIIGLGLGSIQHFFGFIKLNEETYYVSQVPFSISIIEVLYINGITFLVCTFLLIIPAMYVARIQPVKAIKFD